MLFINIIEGNPDEGFYRFEVQPGDATRYNFVLFRTDTKDWFGIDSRKGPHFLMTENQIPKTPDGCDYLVPKMEGVSPYTVKVFAWFYNTYIRNNTKPLFAMPDEMTEYDKKTYAEYLGRRP